MASTIYDQSYFAHYKGEPYGRSETWLRLFGNFATHIVRDLTPKTVLDAGCAMGLLVEALRDRGVEAYGFDISDYAIASAREDIRPFVWQASATDPLDRRYDVITCLEVLEHLEPGDAIRAVENICAHTDDVIFSSSPDDFKEPSHLNLRGPEYWVDLFARCGMIRDVDYEPDYISTWAVRFRRTGEPLHRVVRSYERLVDRLGRENRELREVLVERHEAALNAEAQVATARGKFEAVREELSASRVQCDLNMAQVDAMKMTIAWRLAERGRRLVRRLRR